MRKLKFHCYTLEKKEGEGVREGALLRVYFPDGKVGYADCHPWPELGDLPLEEQLIKQNSPLFFRSLYWAEVDAKARSKGVSLFEGLSIPLSHALISSLEHFIAYREEGFTHFKWKMGGKIREDLPKLLQVLKQAEPGRDWFRLDFNYRLTQGEFARFIEEIEPYTPFIEYCEDPYPFQAESWEDFERIVPLALDQHLETHIEAERSFSVAVLKPATQGDAFLKNCSKEICITSYLDHPLGQAAAAYTAALWMRERPEALLPCGLLSHRNYQTNKWSALLSQTGPSFTPPPGTGFGFDTLLETVDWELLP